MFFGDKNVDGKKKPLTDDHILLLRISIIIILHLRWSLTGKLSPTPTFFQALCNSVINWKAAAEKVEKSGVKKTCRRKSVVKEFGFCWLQL